MIINPAMIRTPATRTTEEWDSFILRSVGVPFVEHGRDYDGLDCWGLVWIAYRDVLGIHLPSLSESYDKVRDWKGLRELFLVTRNEWRKVACPSTGDVAAIYRRGIPIHFGLVIQGGRRILHVEEGIETVHEPISRFRIEGTYRQPEGLR